MNVSDIIRIMCGHTPENDIEEIYVLKENQELKNNINTIVKQEIQKVLTENNRI